MEGFKCSWMFLDLQVFASDVDGWIGLTSKDGLL